MSKKASSGSRINVNFKKVILICTPDLFESREAEYLRQVTEHIGVQQAQRMLLPVMFKFCPALRDAAPTVNMLTKLKWEPKRRERPDCNFYKRLLVDTLRAPEQRVSLRYDEVYLAPVEAAATAAGQPQADKRSNHGCARESMASRAERVDKKSSKSSIACLLHIMALNIYLQMKFH